MSTKEDILKRYRSNVRERFDMPDLSDIKAVTYADPLAQFITMTQSVGGKVIEVEKGRDVNAIIRELFPDEHIERFYSDSHNDDPLAELAEEAFMVKDGKLIPWQ